MNTIINLLLIGVIMSLLYGTGAMEELDAFVSMKWKFMHLPKIIMCQSCATWWICLLYVIFSGNFSLPIVLLCIVMWYLSPIWSKIMYILTDFIMLILDKLSNILNN